MNTIPENIESYPVVIEFPIAWGDMDAFQHVNNVQYFRYFESGRIAYFQELNVMHLMEQTGIGPILKDAYTKFKCPITYPDTLSVGVRVTNLERDRFKMEFTILSHQHRVVTAEGYGTVVYYDYNNHQKADIPDLVRERIGVLERLDRAGLKRKERV